MCLTDLVSVSAAVIAEEQHSAVGKETGETAQVERWNTTLRKPLARFARMTLSFSKSVLMLRPSVCFSFFIAPLPIGSSCLSEPLPSPELNPVELERELVLVLSHLDEVLCCPV